MFEQKVIRGMIAYFLAKNDGAMDKLKLIKLLYLAERAYLLKYHDTMTRDKMVSMPKGPVLSKSLDLINGIGDDAHFGKYFRLAPNNRDVSLRMSEGAAALSALSKADARILQAVWNEFGKLNASQLVKLTHQLPEWDDPADSSLPIKYESILVGEGIARDTARAIADFIKSQSKLSQMLA